MGHDFNNLLGTILGEVDLALARSPEDEDLAESLRAIRRESLRAANLTAQLLAYAGKGSFTQSRLDLSRLVMQSSELLEATVAKRAQLGFDVAGNLPRVLGDPVQLRQVLLHLVQNAAEAMGGRAGTITVRTRLVEDLASARSRLLGDALEAEQRERKALAEALHDDAIQNLLSVRHELEEVGDDTSAGHPALLSAASSTSPPVQPSVSCSAG